jgi:formate C-acetyltransferase
MPPPPTLSAQAAAIEGGKKVMHGTATDRVLRILETIRSGGQPRVALERAIYFTESFKATEGQPLVLRWAKALQHIAEKISVTIFDDELIVGRPNTWPGRYTLVYPELDGSIMKAGAEAFIASKGAPDGIAVTAEDEKIIDEILLPYWNGKDFTPNFVKALPPESRHISFGPEPVRHHGGCGGQSPKNQLNWVERCATSEPVRRTSQTRGRIQTDSSRNPP